MPRKYVKIDVYGQEILELKREGKTNREIACELNISIKDVEYHISKSLKALRKTLKDYLPLFYFFFYHM